MSIAEEKSALARIILNLKQLGWSASKLDDGGDELIDLQVRLFDNVGVLLIEMPLAKDQCITEEAPGVHLIRATVRDTAQLRRWLLSQTPHLEVVSPSAMRQRIAESLRTGLAHYA